MSLETTKQNILSLLDEAQMYVKGHNPHTAGQRIEQAHRELFLLSKAYGLQEFKDIRDGQKKILEAREETNRLLTELLSKHYAEEHELTKALNLLHG